MDNFTPHVTDGDCDAFEQLIGEYLDLYRRNEQPSVEAFAAQHAQHAEKIITLFPTLLALEKVGGVSNSLGLLDQRSPAAAAQVIGDYRLLREIGRGGMGIVYEAEQRSLDRRVALKLLAWQGSSSERAMERFRREAKAAARLHHTNIVPVFEVGQEGNVAFYAMQFIQGQSLDKVITELRRLDRAASTSSMDEASDVLELASCLETRDLSAEPLPCPAPETIRLANDETHTQPPSASSLAAARSDKQHYFRNVAHIGRQIAEALGYAHERGVIHRDIKPSNVLVDGSGVAWVTDFGLAKTEEAAITVTGDVLGTLRYMAPERFRGECDQVSDVYALGVTLYELLVLRPPHEVLGRAELVTQITERDPLPPHALDPQVPRDLERIVLKAMDRDPHHRYASAGALAEDLRRFLADEPILGRRISPAQRLVRWVRRNRVLAASVLATAVALLATAVSASFASSHYQALADQEKHARIETTGLLYRSLFGESKATRLARREGYRHEVWKLLDEARQLDSDAVDRNELRREAILSLGDFVGLKPLVTEGFAEPISSMAVSERAGIVAVGLQSGRLEWRDARTGKLMTDRKEHFAAVTRLTFVDADALLSADERGVVRRWMHKPDGVWESTRLSEDGGRVLALVEGTLERLLVARRLDGLTQLSIDNLQNGRRQSVDAGEVIDAAAFSRDGSMLATVSRSLVAVWRTDNGRLIKRAATKLGGWNQVAFSTDGQLLLCAGEQGVATYGLPDLEQQSFMRCGPVTAAALSHNGTQLTFSSQGRRIGLWNVFGNRELASLQHAARGNIDGLAFGAHDRLLVSAGRQALTIWNLDAASECTHFAGHTSAIGALGFSPSGERIFSASKDGLLTIWNAKTGLALASTKVTGLKAAVFSPAGTRLIVGNDQGELLAFDGESLKLLLTIETPLDSIRNVQFTEKQLIAGGEGGIAGWTIHEGFERQDKPQSPELAFSRGLAVDSLAIEGRLIAAVDGAGKIRVLEPASGTMWLCTAPQAKRGAQTLTFDPDGRHLYYFDKDRSLVKWDVLADTAAKVPNEKTDYRGSHLALNRHGLWLATNTDPWKVSVHNLTDKALFFDLREDAAAVSSLVWSPDQSSLAVGRQDGSIAIWHLAPLRKLLAEIELDWPDDAFQPAAAAEDKPLAEILAKAIEREPKDPALLVRRASLLTQQAKFEAARADLDRALELDAKSFTALAARAELLARASQWKEAAADLQKTLPEQDAIEPWANVALLLAKSDDVTAYREHCGRLLEKFGATTDPATAQTLLLAVQLLPGGGHDLKRLTDLLEQAAKQSASNARRYLTLALGALRSGNDEAVATYIRRAQQDDAYALHPAWQATALAIQAISEHRVGKSAIARETASAASTFLKGVPAAPGGDFLNTHAERLAAEILVSEAKAAVR